MATYDSSSSIDDNAPHESVGITSNGQPLVDKPGDGALTVFDHKKDSHRYVAQTPFKSTRTTMYARQAGKDEEQFDRFWKWHHHWDSDDSSRRTHNDKLNVAWALANSLGLTSYQKYRVLEIVSNINGRRFNKNGGLEGLALGAIAYVGDEEAQRFGSLETRICGSDSFNELCEKHGVDGWKACRRVKKICR